jgi:hypothetical protein
MCSRRQQAQQLLWRSVCSFDNHQIYEVLVKLYMLYLIK